MTSLAAPQSLITQGESKAVELSRGCPKAPTDVQGELVLRYPGARGYTRPNLQNFGRFLTELGRDFCFVGSQYPVQVGNQAPKMRGGQ